MATDRRRLRGERTRHAILAQAMRIASTEGLEGLSLGRLAAELQMSKSGLFAHFGSKEELQIKTLRAARRVFSDAAVAPAQTAPDGIVRLDALVESWLRYFGADAFPGGCLFVAAASEFDGRPGPVRDLIAETMGMWLALLREQAAAAVARGELAPGTDPVQLAWELHAFGLGMNWDVQLNGSRDALARARRAGVARLRAAATDEGRRRLAGRMAAMPTEEPPAQTPDAERPEGEDHREGPPGYDLDEQTAIHELERRRQESGEPPAE